MGTRTTRIRRTNADFNLLDADDTDDADFYSCAIHTGISHRRKKESASSVSERLLARRRRTLLQRYAGKLSFMYQLVFKRYPILFLLFSFLQSATNLSISLLSCFSSLHAWSLSSCSLFNFSRYFFICLMACSSALPVVSQCL